MKVSSLLTMTWCAVVVASSGGARAQNAGDMFNIFGTFMHTAIVGHAQAEWSKLPASEIACIEQQGYSVGNFVQNGVAPDDPKLSPIRSGCTRPRPPFAPTQVLSSEPQPTQGTHAPAEQSTPYMVDDIVLGSKVQLNSDTYKQYSCEPSDQYPGFTRCSWQRSNDDSNSMLHAPDGTVMYVNRTIGSASFKPGEIDSALDRLTRKFGAQPTIIRMPHRNDQPDAFIAVWGELNLEPLDQPSMKTLADGNSPGKGMLVDFLGHFTKSARAGLPVYGISGGRGYVWSVSYDQKGKGTLRFFAMNPRALRPPVVNPVIDTPRPPVVPALPISPTGPVVAQRRIALVIGNGAYERADRLANPVTDARRMRDVLSNPSLGFEVVYGENLTKQALERTIGRFASMVQDADVALVYFAGHGATFGDMPYVVPVDAQFTSLAEVPYELVPVETLIGELRRAKGLRIAILDACRDDTAERELKRVAARGGEVSRGLARVRNPEGLILAYATQYLSTAADGDPKEDSPFTAALLNNIVTPGLDVKDLFYRVGREVIAGTKGAQRPEISVSFYDDYALVPAVALLQGQASIRP